MAVRRNSRNKALMADLDNRAKEVKLQEQEYKDPKSNNDVVVKEEVTETPDVPTAIFKEKSSIVKKQFSDAIGSFDTIITKSNHSHFVQYLQCLNKFFVLQTELFHFEKAKYTQYQKLQYPHQVLSYSKVH